MDDHPDYQIRQWVLDSSVAMNSGVRVAKIEKVISDAEKMYGFIIKNNNNIVNIKEAKQNDQS